MNEKDKITYFAETDYRKKVPFGIKASDRTRHVYIIGKTGMGKSTCLENMAIQDIQNGNGMCFVDPHGKTAELLLKYVPKERIDDVINFAPFDMEYPLSFNIMEDVGYDKRHLVANGLMSAFKKIWVDMWSARMEYILNNVVLALLEYPNSTLLGVNKMLTDKEYRKKVVDNITDPSTKSFWVDEFAKYTDRYTQEATPAIQNKIGQFTANPLIRNIIGQPKSSFNFRKAIDTKKIIIINLAKGRIGEGNANLLGSMIITKLYLAAMSRADLDEHELAKYPNFYLFVDEFQSFANESFADILSEARKYKLNLTIAHQYIEQMPDEVRSAVFGNVGTMITFRVGAYDAEVLEKEFSPKFTADDMVNLGFTQIYLKLMIDGVSSQPFSATTLPPIQEPEHSSYDLVVKRSRELYARPRREVEELINKLYAGSDDAKPETSKSGGDRGNGRSGDFGFKSKPPKTEGYGAGSRSIDRSQGSQNRQAFHGDRRVGRDDRGFGDRRDHTDRRSGGDRRATPGQMSQERISLNDLKKQAIKEDMKVEATKSSENMGELKDALKNILAREKKEEKNEAKTAQKEQQKNGQSQTPATIENRGVNEPKNLSNKQEHATENNVRQNNNDTNKRDIDNGGDANQNNVAPRSQPQRQQERLTGNSAGKNNTQPTQQQPQKQRSEQMGQQTQQSHQLQQSKDEIPEDVLKKVLEV